MKRLILFIGFVFLITEIFAQQGQETGVVEGGPYKKIHMEKRQPMEFQYVREADVMWSKVVWRKIDLREKINHPLYYPTEPIGSRMSLIQLLMWGIETENIKAYDPTNSFNEFQNRLTMKDVKERFGAKDEVQMVENVETGQLEQKKIEGTYNLAEVKEIVIKELWFFDRQRSVMDVRILGICPIRYFYKPEDTEREDVQKRPLFWVSYSEARKILANHEVFNPINDAERWTFDDLFVKRFFASYIYKESNAYNDRRVEEYSQGVESLLESDRIKDKIINFELDLWEF